MVHSASVGERRAADPFSNTVAVTIRPLRRKLGDAPPIETVVGVGYRL